jgi:hypothetical protein
MEPLLEIVREDCQKPLEDITGNIPYPLLAHPIVALVELSRVEVAKSFTPVITTEVFSE